MIPEFPKFYKLKPEATDKELYNRSTAGYPPYSDILFSTLQIWWNLYGNLEVSSLKGNIVINYQLPFDKDSSGYCLVGKYQVDESMRVIFDHLKSTKLEQKLVHVPEFTLIEIKDKSIYTIEEETDYNEYILDSNQLSKLEGSSHGHIRTQINRFLREVEGKKVEHKYLDLSVAENQDHIFKSILEWEKNHPPKNDPDRSEHDALKKTLSHAAALDIESSALYIDDKLHGVILYHLPQTKDHYVIHHLRFDYSVPYTSDFMTQHLASKAVKANVPYINMEMDLGKENLRRHKKKLMPIHFYKKYTIYPAKKNK